MSVNVFIPTPLRPYAGHQSSVSLDADTVGNALQQLTETYPDLTQHLYNDEGTLRSFVNVYVGDEDIRQLDGPDTAVDDGDEVRLVPAVAGGRPTAQIDEQAVDDVELSHEEIQRYSRHLIMPEVTMAGQKKLKAARVLMVGTGGLGAPLGLYLAAAGVGTLGLVDFDDVEESNLQRQVIHGTSDVGRPKLDSARDRIQDVNPYVNVETHEARLSSENALEIVQDYDIVVDGTDNFPTRYLVNDACAMLGVPNVYGSIFRFEGQATVFDANRGPCYRCLYPEPPPPGLVPSCAEGGVLGILPGLVGTIQATETIKLILGQGEPLIGRLLLVDALGMTFRELNLRQNPDCPVCGDNPTVTELIDYEAFCGIGTDGGEEESTDVEISPQQLKERLDRGDSPVLLDVRDPFEWDISHLDRAKLIPLGELPERLHELDSSDEIVAYCRTGGRSAEAVELLREAGFAKLKNLHGGINAWARQVDPSKPTY
ncbi:MAG: ubiquitin-like small modifier protein 1 [Salinibacter sp.]